MSTMTTPITAELELYLESISIIKKDSSLDIFNSAKQFNKEDMQISWLEAKLYQLLITLNNAKSILEIGTFVGFSATMAADCLPEDGKIITCEHDKNYYNQAIKNITKYNYQNKIEIIYGDAKESILKDNISNKIFDIIFLDGDKENYPFYFEKLKNNLKKGGLFLVDNTLFKGEVVSKHKSNYAKGIMELNQIFFEQDEFMISHITIGDGLLIAIKK